MWNLKYDTDELIYKQNETHRPREQTCGCQGGQEGKEWESGISRCKLVYIGWINNKTLLYSTGNYIRYPVIKRNGKEHEKEYVHICRTESLCCIAEINTHCKSTILQSNFKEKFMKKKLLGKA